MTVPGRHLVKPRFIIVSRRVRQSPELARNLNSLRQGQGATALNQFPFVADRGSVTDACALMAQFGEDAGFEAAARADASRNRGNVVNFCRWRQIERMIVVLAHPQVGGTLH